MPTFSSINDALNYAKKQIQKTAGDVLFEDVADIVRETERDHIYTDVYSRPTSGAYKRRYDNGGFGSLGNIVKRRNGDEVVISNETPFNPYLNGMNSSGGISQNASRAGGLDGLVNYGDGWNGVHYDWSTEGPTQFLEKTVTEIQSTGKHISTLKQGLRERGLDVG